MRRLRRKHQFAIVFSLYFFAFLILFSLLFYILFRMILNYQLKRDLSHEISEVVMGHLNTKSDQIQFLKNKSGESLRQYLFNEGVSAVFYDNTLGVLRTYGVFEVSGESEKNTNEKLKNAAKKALKSNIVLEEKIDWNNENYFSYIVPLQYDKKIIGIMVLAKSLGNTLQTTNTMMTVLFSLGVVGLTGSFFLGYILANKAFIPIKNITRIVEGIDLERLDKTVQIEGHPEDEIVLLSKKFNAMLFRLRDMSAKQKEFVANASHELKTPITKAVSSLDVILSQKTYHQKELTLVKNDLLEISNLIDELLLLSRIKEKSTLPKGNTKLGKLVTILLHKFESDLKEKKIKIYTQIQPNFILPMPDKYSEIVFSNLVSNAIKFSPRSQPIYIKGNFVNNNNTIEIIDQGIGMTEKEITKVFERFYRVNSSRHLVKGYGIGLSLVKQICELYDISIQIFSEKNIGTRILLSFPIS